REVQEVNLKATLRYLKDITPNFGIDILVGGNQQRNFDETISGGGSNFNVPFLHTVKNLANQSVGYGFSKFQVNSAFGAAEFSFFNSLYVTATGRLDVFSTLTDPNGAESENSIFYPSVGVAYDLGEGLDLPGFIDLAKVRAAWAQVGGATDPYRLGLTYGIFGQGHLGNPLGGVSSGSIPPAGLVPSTNQEFEVGLDLFMYAGRVHVDFAYYNRTTTDGILSAAVSPTSGFGSKVVNVGEISNNGVELLLDVSPVKQGDFRWDLGFNVSHNVNEVVSLLTPEADDEQIRLQESRTRNAYIHLVEGLPYSQVMGFQYARDASGNIQLDDDGLPVQGELMPFGTGVHPTSLGINNAIRWRDLTFSFLIDVKTGAKIYNATNAYGYFRGLHRATLEGRETGLGAVPAEDVENYYQRIAFGISEEFIDDADFAKLREVILSYNIPRDLTSKIGVQGASLSFAARNLAVLWRKTDNIDPESTYTSGNGQGLEMFGVPVARSYGLNLNVKF
ncbi:MAG: TonB-dependent receptor, partial [Bacteroidota bacterium]